jgi:hypothetical protein
MKKIFVLSLIFPAFAFGYSGTIQKIKGTRAIVEFERNAKIHEGDLVSSEMDSGSGSKSGGKYQNRDYSIGYQLSYVNMAYSATAIRGTSTALNMTVAFGVSFSSFEIGPVVSYLNSQNSLSTTANTTTMYGVFGQYNFVANKAGAVWVPFVGGKYTMSSTTGGTNDTYMGGYVGIQWFPIGNNVSIQASLFYGQVTSSGSNGATEMDVVTGPVLGPVIYF